MPGASTLDLMMEFCNDSVIIKNLKGKKLVTGYKDSSGLYSMNMVTINQQSKTQANFTNINTWHQRLGHLNYDSLKVMGFNNYFASHVS